MFKVGDIVRVDINWVPPFYVSKDFLADCIITKIEEIFVDEGPTLATIERCDGLPFHVIAYDGQATPSAIKDVSTWVSNLTLVESRRF